MSGIFEKHPSLYADDLAIYIDFHLQERDPSGRPLATAGSLDGYVSICHDLLLRCMALWMLITLHCRPWDISICSSTWKIQQTNYE